MGKKFWTQQRIIIHHNKTHIKPKIQVIVIEPLICNINNNIMLNKKLKLRKKFIIISLN